MDNEILEFTINLLIKIKNIKEYLKINKYVLGDLTYYFNKTNIDFNDLLRIANIDVSSNNNMFLALKLFYKYHKLLNENEKNKELDEESVSILKIKKTLDFFFKSVSNNNDFKVIDYNSLSKIINLISDIFKHIMIYYLQIQDNTDSLKNIKIIISNSTEFSNKLAINNIIIEKNDIEILYSFYNEFIALFNSKIYSAIFDNEKEVFNMKDSYNYSTQRFIDFLISINKINDILEKYKCYLSEQTECSLIDLFNFLDIENNDKISYDNFKSALSLLHSNSDFLNIKLLFNRHSNNEGFIE